MRNFQKKIVMFRNVNDIEGASENLKYIVYFENYDNSVAKLTICNYMAIFIY